MPLAATLTSAMNYESWIALHTDYCHRHRCRLTVADCAKQQHNSHGANGDLRCQGCGGLNNQPEAFDKIGALGTARPLLQLVRPITIEAPEAMEGEPAARISKQAEHETCLDGGENELARELQRGFLEEDEPERFDDDADFNDECIDNDGLDNEVLRLFPELQEFIEEYEEKPNAAGNEPRRGRYKAKSKHHESKCAVYMGRCKRCQGYMINALERHDGIKDDDVYRCFTCGWRTSPVYQSNRLQIGINGRGGNV